jgi:hypothetical protein
MQDDGNFVLYNDSYTYGYWSTETNKPQNGPGPFTLVLEYYGNVVIYNSKNVSIWSALNVPITTPIPTTTQIPITTQMSTTTQIPITTQMSTTTQIPITTQIPTTTQMLTTMKPTTTIAPTTTQIPTTTIAPITTPYYNYNNTLTNVKGSPLVLYTIPIDGYINLINISGICTNTGTNSNIALINIFAGDKIIFTTDGKAPYLQIEPLINNTPSQINQSFNYTRPQHIFSVFPQN